MLPRSFAPLALAGLAACSTPSGEYPSLAIRDAERVSGTIPAPAPFVPSATPAPVLDRLAGLTRDAASAHAAFQNQAPAARRTVSAARGAGVGSENWAQAQVALAGLEAARSQAMIALADLDRIYVDAAVEGTELERIAAARQRVADMVEAESALIAELAAALR
ncbi:hypothetical protein GRI75_07465 [Altererythrobacter soli]|uniref:Uncharacterized protein n=1 Tax=Croceibacterium soli TaxID=1739690 RepID=A0A6I4UR69_9SPHN|nr:hypothetical protein [Croceibacterium soli]MXP41480.1 hypothetical protein [Croceibacterium soli]